MLPILITSYINPDLDGVACAIGYAEFLQKKKKAAVSGILGEPHVEAKYVLDRFGLKYPPSFKTTGGFDRIILVDVSSPKDLEGKVEVEKVIEIIDHRTVHDVEKFPKAKTQIELVGSCATLIAEKFIEQNVEISPDTAILLYSAIISNTLNFKAGVTTERDKKAATWLNQTAALPENYWRELFTAKSDLSGPKLVEILENDLAEYNFGNKKIGIAQLEIIGSKELLTKRGKDIETELERLKSIKKLDLIFLNIIDLKEGISLFVTTEDVTQKLLAAIFNLKFSGIMAVSGRLLMRKQILPLLKTALEKNA